MRTFKIIKERTSRGSLSTAGKENSDGTVQVIDIDENGFPYIMLYPDMTTVYLDLKPKEELYFDM